ncbi:MAG: hypothetical protein OXB84_06345 [Halobacteriovoraceae bacterium]|nr:hypothetical protein [Halobacteriovoraceae bacterium]
MGLLFPFAVTLKETDRVKVVKESLVVKTYGLPLIFWGYLAAILTILCFMYLAVSKPLVKYYQHGQAIDQILAVLVYLFFICIPIVSLGFFFYEKVMIKKKDRLHIIHKLFYLPYHSRKFKLTGEFFIHHFTDSPNMASKKGYPAAFRNKGYFYLYAHTSKGVIQIDRHSQKGELKKLKILLENF